MPEYSFVHDPEVDHRTVYDGAQFETLMRELAAQKSFTWDVEGDGVDPFKGRRIIGHGFAWRRENGQLAAFYTPTRHESLMGLLPARQQLDADMVTAAVKPVLENPSVTKCGHYLHTDVMLAWADDIQVSGPLHDTLTASKLINENLYGYKLTDCLRTFRIKHDPDWKKSINPDIEQQSKHLFGTKGIKKVVQAHGYKYCDTDLMGTYACQDVVYEQRLAEYQVPFNQRWWDTWQLEMELFWCAVDMRKKGVPVVPQILQDLAEEQQERMRDLQAFIWKLAGEEFDVGNDNELRRILFDKLGYPFHAKTKGKWVDGEKVNQQDKVDDDALWWLEKFHGCQLAKYQREWNKAAKIVSTYTLPIIELTDDHNILHTEFDPGGAKTGRFSCLTGGAAVRTREGVVRMDEVQAGMEVWTHQQRWRPVVRQWRVGEREVLDFKLANGNVLSCTRSHRLLCSDGEWRTAGVIYERFKEVGGEPQQPQVGCEAVPAQGSVDVGGDCRSASNNVSQRAACGEIRHSYAGAESLGGLALFGVERGGEESDEGAIGIQTSAVEGHGFRRARILDPRTGRPAIIRASAGVGAGVGCSGIAGMGSDPSHRRESEEQRIGQSGGDDSSGSRAYSLVAGAGLQSVAIEEINVGGSHTVYDLMVAEDETFEVEGIVSHNSRDPNLQNIPIRTPLGRRIREAFIAREGMVRYCLDYSQIELRVLAHLSQDPLLLKVYREGGDVHRTTAMEVFGSDQKVDGIDMRRLAKILNFGIPFGITEIGVQRNLNKDLPEGQDAIDEDRATWALNGWYHKYAGVDAWRKSIWYQFAQNGGEGWNMFGRPRRVEDILSDKAWKRSRAEREITSTMAQGGAADLIKRSMLRTWQYLKSQQDCEAYLVLMIHDDLQFDMMPDGSAKVIRECKKIMESTCQDVMSVPIKVDVEYFTDNWKNKREMEAFH